MIDNGTEAVIAKIKDQAFQAGHAQAFSEIREQGKIVVDRRLIEARLTSGHNDTCSAEIGHYMKCTCGHEDLQRTLNDV
jgi:hypothetical protein